MVFLLLISKGMLVCLIILVRYRIRKDIFLLSVLEGTFAYKNKLDLHISGWVSRNRVDSFRICYS